MSTPLFRRQVVNRLSSPEQYEDLLDVTTAKAWWTLSAIILFLLLLLAWSIYGRLPLYVSGHGLLIKKGGVHGVFSEVQGRIDRILVQSGDRVIKGQELLLVNQQAIRSPVNGRIAELRVQTGARLDRGQTVAIVDPDSQEKEPLLGYIYVPAAKGKSVFSGMPAQLSPSTVMREEHGYILGQVSQVSEYPSSEASMMRHFNNRDFVRAMLAAGPVIEVEIALTEELQTPSGYKWSSQQGPDVVLTPGTIAWAQILIRERRPISLLLPYLKHVSDI